MKYDLEDDIEESPTMIKLMEDMEFSKLLYASLTNTDWTKRPLPPYTTEQTFEALSIPQTTWFASFRYVAGMIARIRSKHYNVNEDFMDFYLKEQEGKIDPWVAEELAKLGWNGV